MTELTEQKKRYRISVNFFPQHPLTFRVDSYEHDKKLDHIVFFDDKTKKKVGFPKVNCAIEEECISPSTHAEGETDGH